MKKPVILCVDDEKVVLSSLKAQLINNFSRDYSIEVAESGEEAIEIIKDIEQNNISLPVAIVDHIMPGMKGDELLAKIHQLFPRTNNIMLTGQADADAVGRAVNNANLYRYIAKPWDPTDLNLTISEAIKSYFQDKTIIEQNIQLDELVQQLKTYNEELEDTVKTRTAEVQKQKEELQANLETIKIAHQKLSESEKKLKELDDFKSKFFANISHEFRTPLSLIIASIDDLLNSEMISIDDEYSVQLIKKNSDRLYRLVNQLLELSKLDEGKMEILLRKGNVVNALNDILSNYESLAKQKHIQFEINHINDAIEAYWDQDKLEIILHNLLSNAFKYTPELGNVDFTSAQCDYSDIVEINNLESSEKKIKEKYLKVKVKDSGSGIAADKLEKIFDRFEKFEVNQKQYSEGMGIGLALTRELVQFLKGFLFVNSIKGEGAEFIVYLPINKTAFTNARFADDKQIMDETKTDKTQLINHEDSIVNPSESQLLEEQMTVDAETILIVEDNADMRSYISKNLRHNYQIELAEDGEEGVQKAIRLIPDLIITDLMMPKRDGLSLCNILKDDERTCHIPVIMLTAKASLDNKIEGLKTGADDYLVKPFKIDELKVRINNLIKQRQQLKEKYSKLIGFDIDCLEISSKDEVFFKKCMQLVEQNLLNEHWSIEEFSMAMNLSRSQLFRKVKALTGMSVTELILNHRLEKAAKLIQKDAADITEIAFHVGFNTASYFTKSFKRKYNLSPRDYSRIYKKKS